MSFQSWGTHCNGERKFYGYQEEVPGPLCDEPLTLCGSFLHKDQFFKNDKDSGSWKELNPENETIRWCQNFGMKCGWIKEQRTLYWVSFLLIILALFCLNMAFDQTRRAAKKFPCYTRKRWGKWVVTLKD